MNTTKPTEMKIAPFKSMRAAKMSYTKAENAWNEMRNLANGLVWERRQKMQDNGGSMDCVEYQDYERRIEEANKAVPVLFEKLRMVYNQAESQWKYSMPTWHFGHNPTRDLIAANMD